MTPEPTLLSAFGYADTPPENETNKDPRRTDSNAAPLLAGAGCRSLISPDGNLHACRHHEVDILITRVPPSEAATKTGSWAAASRGVN